VTSGIDEPRLDGARTFLVEAIAAEQIPGAVALIARADDVVAHWALGHAQAPPSDQPRPMQPDTIFDLASLTKAVGGATAALLLLEDGVWSLDEPVASFIPEFGQRGKAAVTLRQVLTHTTGFGGWVAGYAFARDPESTLAHVCGLELADLPGTVVRYSDVGLSMVGHLVRRVTGQGMDVLLRERVWEPLGMRDTGYNPPVELRPRIAATEHGNCYERQMLANLGLTFDGWRDHLLVGEVNDGNTAYALGGVSSHAGLFSTAPDLLRFARMYLAGGALDGRRILSPASIAEATANQTVGLNQSRGLGWELLRKGRRAREEFAAAPQSARIFPAARNSAASPRNFGDLLSGRTYGHTGFTGTSLAIDPAHELIVILLTNRIHPDATNFAINTVRARFHNLVAAALV
jgi:serine-type D-Ala-D-Ala carboxypeptidase